MKILFITEKFPYPLDTGGNVRTFNILKGLSRKHEVTLLATTQGEVTEQCIREVGSLCRDIKLIGVKSRGIAHDIYRLMISLMSAVPFVLSRHAARSVRAEIARAFNTAGLANGAALPAFDAVHFNHLDAALYADVVPAGVMRIMDEHNVVANQVKTALMTEDSMLRRLILRHEYPKLRSYEAKICNEMNLCLACSGADATTLRLFGNRSRTVVVPNGVDTGYFSLNQSEQRVTSDIVFVGTMDYDPCEKGVWYFCNEIFPLVKREIPDIRFIVVGRNPSGRLRALAKNDPALVLTGRVEDIRPIVWRARIFVVPLLSGSGTRLKILEAMSMGIPVVSTTIGAEGLEANSGEHLLLADDADRFADSIITLFRNSALVCSLRENSRQLVESKYDWQAIQDLLLTEYASLVRS